MTEYLMVGLLLNKAAASMIRIATTAEIDEKVIEDLPDWTIGTGLLVCLDIKDDGSLLVEPGNMVRVHRPDGTFIDRIAKGVSPPGLGDGWAVSLFLPHTKQHEIPTGSEIELPPFNIIPLFPPAA
ncbi:MAG TPA: hypothetical protein VGJ73_21105 [Verrucomicrobiae bacterium]